VHNFNEWAYLCEHNTRIKKYLDNGIWTCKRDLHINASPLLCWFVYQRTWSTNRSIAFTSVLLSEDSEKSSTLIPDFLQIRQIFWCLCLTDVRHKSLQLMEGIDQPHTGKYKEITNDSNYDASCTLTSLPVWDLENYKRLIFFCTECTKCIFIICYITIWKFHFGMNCLLPQHCKERKKNLKWPFTFFFLYKNIKTVLKFYTLIKCILKSA
jgi:hypothetical protein